MSALFADMPQAEEMGSKVLLENSLVRLEFDLSRGTYDVFKQDKSEPALAGAHQQINEWSSDSEGSRLAWSKRTILNSLGKGEALHLTVTPKNGPELLFSFHLYKDQSFISATAGILNTTKEIVRVRKLRVLADAAIYPESNSFQNFAMIDGFSGGEPLEYGERFYSPLSRANAIKGTSEKRLLSAGGDSRPAFQN